jgi:hypothetical protein
MATNEELKTVTEEQIFPRYPQKTYGLMEMMKGSSTIVGKGGEQDSVLSWPNLIILEFIVVLASTVGLLVWALVQNAPLTEMANPDVTENPAKAPWYFLGLQELLLHMNASLAGVLVPTLLIVLLLALPYFDRNTRDVGVWFASRKGRVISIFSFLYGFIWIAVLVPLDALFPIKTYLTDAVKQNFGPGQTILALDAEFLTQILTGWIYPIAVMGGLIAAMMITVKIIWQPNLREMVLAMFSAFVGVLVMLTLWSTWFRGKNMLLMPPSEVMTSGYGFLIGPLVMIAIGVVLTVLINGVQKKESNR